MLVLSPVPEISISLASPEEPAPEPFSPFSQCTFLSDDYDSFRPTLLSPPPPVAMTPKQLSPLRPKDAPLTGKGLERERFEALLQAQRERNAALGSKRSPTDLRKEIALKVHKSKQMERRALFLSKVQAPPSPSATFIPVTPPESPAVFHYSLPSPGLESPLEVFEALTLGRLTTSTCQPWVEQVDFRLAGDGYRKILPRPAPATVIKRKILPSLDQITARLSTNGHVATPVQKGTARPSMRLPSFLTPARVGQPEAKAPKVETQQPGTRARAPLLAAVGRLRFPTKETAEAPKVEIAQPTPCLPPASPQSPIAPRLQITTTVVPRTASSSPIDLTESNLMAFTAGSRERTARNMLTRLRRRTLPPQIAVPAPGEFDMEEEVERKSRRHSAPPELPRRNRIGFTHPILELPGAF
ncbi:hypothetical protein LXA43DRAFT_262670 [Ganoderma leucocontextum]|nr:hypothetical protein LXA43DRAFT_262670 [Ganoderma leucocontextum]